MTERDNSTPAPVQHLVGSFYDGTGRLSSAYEPTPEAISAARNAFCREFGTNGTDGYYIRILKWIYPFIAPSEQGRKWTHVKTPPTAGGPYLIGGYINDGVMPRHFRSTFGYLIITTDGPEWSHKRHEDHRIPIEYWCEIPEHPERRAPTATEGSE